MNIILVALGGAMGAVARFLLQNLVGQTMGKEFPYGTMLINITGSIAMGLLIGWLARTTPSNQQSIQLFIAVGILGGYTTFSSFSLDAITLMENGKITAMVVYVLTSVIVSLVGLLAGLYIVRTIA